MKLISCTIENFGILHREERNFQDGLNVIYAPNGSGKSTLAVFIKAMLYGLPASTKRSVTENERKHYQPWQGGAYGGTLSFSVGNKRYRIERFFGSKESEDSFTLIDLDTNLPSTEYSERIGYELFGIGAEAYERSTYVSQRQLNGKTDHNDLQAKLANLLEESGDLSSYDEAMERLEKRRKFYQMTGGRGALAEAEAEVLRSEQAIRDCRTRLEKVREDQNKLKTEMEHLAQNEIRRRKLSEQLEQAITEEKRREILERYQSLCREKNRLEEEQKGLLKFFGDTVPDAEQVEGLTAEERRLFLCEGKIAALTVSESDRKRLAKLSERFVSLSADHETKLTQAFANLEKRECLLRELEGDRVRLELLEEQEKQETLERNREKTKRKRLCFGGFLAAGLLLIAAGILAFWLSPIPAVILGGLDGILWFILLLWRRKEGTRGADASVTEALQTLRGELELKIAECHRLEEQLAQFLGELPPNGAFSAELHRYSQEQKEYLSLLASVRATEERRRQLEEESDECSDRLHHVLEAWYDPDGMPLRDQITDLAQKQTKLQTVREELAERTRQLEEFLEKHPEEPLTEQSLPAADATDQENREDILKQLREQMEREERDAEHLRSRIAYLQEQVRQRSATEETLDDLEREHDRIAERIAEYSDRLKAILEAERYLTRAKEQLSARYLDRMQEGFRHYFEKMTGRNPTDYEMNTSFEVKVRAEGKQYDTEYLSRGYRDAVGICVRFALTDALFEEEKPFLILDDPFVNLDDENNRAARKLISALGEECQILYLVCSQARI